MSFFCVGAADGGVVEEQRGREDCGWRVAEVVGDPEILARGFDAGAKSALVDVVEHRAAHQFALAVEADAIEQART